VILKPLIDLHGEPRNWATAAPLYFEALADIPPEILAIAVKDQIATNQYFPKPAELRRSVVDELAAFRRRREEAARAAAALPEPERTPPSPEDIAYVSELCEEIRRGMAERSAIIRGPAE
jgi:hypothetical protein